MYKMTYAEIIEGDCRQARANEQQAFNQAIAMMQEADGKDITAPEVFAAVQNVQKLWVFLIENLSDPANELAPALKKDLISIGIWAIREAGRFVGITGLEHRVDGRGVALRFALWPEAQGRGLAREAAFAALRFGHDRAGLPRIVAAARETNFGSRMVLGGIGMWEAGSFEQRGYTMILYESVV